MLFWTNLLIFGESTVIFVANAVVFGVIIEAFGAECDFVAECDFGRSRVKFLSRVRLWMEQSENFES